MAEMNPKMKAITATKTRSHIECPAHCPPVPASSLSTLAEISLENLANKIMEIYVYHSPQQS